ncbi:MAG: hypothetical protein KGI54_04945 [Pseudomonadota bacterium]|nr:hypothetical protein [Pseudomonadota bacterium]
MNRILKALLALFIVLAPVAAKATVFNNTMLVVRQAYANGISSIQAFVVHPTGTGDTLQTTTNGIPQSLAGSFGAFPATNYTTGMTDSQIISAFTTSMGGTIPVISGGMETYMSQNGIDTGEFEFEQTLPSGRFLIETVTVDNVGNVYYGGPRIVAQSPTILYAIYTPLAVASGLPSSWQYPNAGTIQWQLRDMDWNQLTPFQTINTNGAFDPPQESSSTVNPDAGLECLIDNSSSASCPTGYTDIKTLIGQNNASIGILDYVRMLAPVYTVQSGVQVASVSLSVNTRTLTYAGCGANISYNNVGSYGYTLNNTTDRYMVEEDGTYSHLNQFTSQTLSPTQSYNYTVSLPAADAATLDPQIIDPGGSGTLEPASNFPGIIYLAPISVVGSSTDSTSMTLNLGGAYISTTYTATCSPSTGVQVTIPYVDANTSNGTATIAYYIYANFAYGTAGAIDVGNTVSDIYPVGDIIVRYDGNSTISLYNTQGYAGASSLRSNSSSYYQNPKCSYNSRLGTWGCSPTNAPHYICNNEYGATFTLAYTKYPSGPYCYSEGPYYMSW